jgi:hypothetical protein
LRGQPLTASHLPFGSVLLPFLYRKEYPKERRESTAFG